MDSLAFAEDLFRNVLDVRIRMDGKEQADIGPLFDKSPQHLKIGGHHRSEALAAVRSQ